MQNGQVITVSADYGDLYNYLYKGEPVIAESWNNTISKIVDNNGKSLTTVENPDSAPDNNFVGIILTGVFAVLFVVFDIALEHLLNPNQSVLVPPSPLSQNISPESE